MLSTNLLKGDRVELVALEPERDSKLWAEWRQNSEFTRLLDDAPATLYSRKANKEWMEKHLEDFLEFEFMIRPLDQTEPIGFVGLEGNIRFHQDAFIGIGLGNPANWGKGYGTESMNLILRYAFLELNLHRVSLNVFGYNERAIRSYQKNGFVIEGKAINAIERDSKFWDVYYMGILKREWLKSYQEISWKTQ